MERNIGLDVSLKSTAICIVDAKGKIVREGIVATDPEVIATFIAQHAAEPVRIGWRAVQRLPGCGPS
jgi:transposase